MKKTVHRPQSRAHTEQMKPGTCGLQTTKPVSQNHGRHKQQPKKVPKKHDHLAGHGFRYEFDQCPQYGEGEGKRQYEQGAFQRLIFRCRVDGWMIHMGYGFQVSGFRCRVLPPRPIFFPPIKPEGSDIKTHHPSTSILLPESSALCPVSTWFAFSRFGHEVGHSGQGRSEGVGCRSFEDFDGLNDVHGNGGSFRIRKSFFTGCRPAG